MCQIFLLLELTCILFLSCISLQNDIWPPSEGSGSLGRSTDRKLLHLLWSQTYCSLVLEWGRKRRGFQLSDPDLCAVIGISPQIKTFRVTKVHQGQPPQIIRKVYSTVQEAEQPSQMTSTDKLMTELKCRKWRGSRGRYGLPRIYRTTAWVCRNWDRKAKDQLELYLVRDVKGE